MQFHVNRTYMYTHLYILKLLETKEKIKIFFFSHLYYKLYNLFININIKNFFMIALFKHKPFFSKIKT